MKHLAILLKLIILFSILSGCEKDEHYSRYADMEIDPFIMKNYYYDARQLYFEEIINNSSHKNYNNPILDENGILEILGIIQAIYNLKIPETDAIFNYHQIHVHSCYSFNLLSLNVKPEYPEIENLSNNIIPTGNQQLDDILLTYDIDSVKTPHYYPNHPFLDIYSNNDYNLIPIANALSNVESIENAEIYGQCGGDGNDISLKRNNNSSITITFSIGWGDCPAGCTNHQYWEFVLSSRYTKFSRTYFH